MAIIVTAYPSSLEVTQGEHIVEGGVLVNDVEFRFPEDDTAWKGMALVACFETVLGAWGQVLDSDRTCKIPWEAIDWGSAGSYIKIGLYGAKEDDLAVIVRDTEWVTMPFRVLPGADAAPPSSDETQEGAPPQSQDPTPSQYQQMLAQTAKVLSVGEAVLAAEQTAQTLINRADEHARQAGIYANQAGLNAGAAKGAETNAAASASSAENSAGAAALSAKEAKEAMDNIGKSEERIDTLEKQVADLMYEPIAITAFSHNTDTKERGETVTSVKLTWATNKEPTALTLDGEALDVSDTSKSVSGLNITHYNGKTWKLVATDERDKVVERSTPAFVFLNCVYYGMAAQPEAIDSAFVRSLATKTDPTSTRKRTITVAGDGSFVWYCLPAELGKCSFTSNGFPAGIELVDTIAFTNALGHTENYYVYRSNQRITDTVTIGVS